MDKYRPREWELPSSAFEEEEFEDDYSPPKPSLAHKDRAFVLLVAFIAFFCLAAQDFAAHLDFTAKPELSKDS